MITIQADFEVPGADLPAHHLLEGESRWFGRGGGSTAVDIALAPGDRAVSRLAGVIESVGDHWRLTNTSNKTYVVEHTERISGYVMVRPGTQGMAIPFETSRVRVPGTDQEYRFLVMAPELACIPSLVDDTGPDPSGERTDASYRLDPWNMYFKVMVAFCEPQLLDPASRRIPTKAEVAKRIGLKPAAVNGHIDFLLNTKLRVPEAGDGKGISWRHQTLVEYALRFELVTSDHLAFLPEETDPQTSERSST